MIDEDMTILDFITLPLIIYVFKYDVIAHFVKATRKNE